MSNNNLTLGQVMSLNRKERRRIGKLNDMKIKGALIPHINPERQKKKALKKVGNNW